MDSLCTPCHDPHGVSPILGANQKYAVPTLKGTWLTSPYKEDGAPANTNECRGYYNWCGSSTPGYTIDQNTFANWNINSTAGISETEQEFGGLCLTCHPQDVLDPDTSGKGAWKSLDRIHDTVKGWGGAKHNFPCSKCHLPHNSGLPRLMQTNCLDYNHRGRIASGGSPAQYRDYGDYGEGGGQYPSGGGGDGDLWSGSYFFGTVSQSEYNWPERCHGTSGAGGTSWPGNQKWNDVTLW
jgi:hypothetical protein